MIQNYKIMFDVHKNIQHRIIYKVYEKEKAIKILRMWTHYELK